MGYKFHPQVYDGVWPYQLGLRLPDLRFSASPATGYDRAIQDRVVHGVGYFGIPYSAGNPKQKAFLQEQARKIPSGSHYADRSPDSYFPANSFCNTFWLQTSPLKVILILGAIVGLYIFIAETIKRIFYKKVKF